MHQTVLITVVYFSGVIPGFFAARHLLRQQGADESRACTKLVLLSALSYLIFFYVLLRSRDMWDDYEL